MLNSPNRAPGHISHFRNFVFGVEDGLVSTVGLLSGIAVAGVSKETIFLTGIVLLLVEGFSMGAGSFLSESSAEEYEHGRSAFTGNNILSGVIMFLSYFAAGFIPLAPYLLVPVGVALPLSIALSVIALFILGSFGARLSKVSVLRSGMRMAIIGGGAIALGIMAGSLM